MGADGGPFAVLPNGPIISFAPDGRRSLGAAAPRRRSIVADHHRCRRGLLGSPSRTLGFSTARGHDRAVVALRRAGMELRDFAVSSGVPLVAVAPSGGLYFALWFVRHAGDRRPDVRVSRRRGISLVGKLDAPGTSPGCDSSDRPTSERVVGCRRLGVRRSRPARQRHRRGSTSARDRSAREAAAVGFLARLDDQGATPLGARVDLVGRPRHRGFARCLSPATSCIGSNFSEAVDVAGTTVHTGARRRRRSSCSSRPTGRWRCSGSGTSETGAATSRSEQLVVDPAGAMIVAGSFQGKLDLGSGILQSAGSFDVFLARVNP